MTAKARAAFDCPAHERQNRVPHSFSSGIGALVYKVAVDDGPIRLTGDVVEPRREFIQQNALSVANLDV